MDVDSWSMKNMSYSLAFLCDVEEEPEEALEDREEERRRVTMRWS